MIFFLFVLLVVWPCYGVVLLFYKVPKRFGYPKFGKALALLAGIFFTVVIIMCIFEDQLFTKKEAANLLKEQGIVLHDKFDLVSNTSSYALADYYHRFELRISEKDRDKIISEIRSAPNFELKEFENAELYAFMGIANKVIWNFETKTSLVRSYGISHDTRVIIEKAGNSLVFQIVVE